MFVRSRSRSQSIFRHFQLAAFIGALSLIGYLLPASAAMQDEPEAAPVEFEFVENDGVLELHHGDRVVTRYLVDEQPKPIMWPLYGPHDLEMTRGYPMRDAIDTEKADHPHHRSLWFTHGDVNGVSFWHEGNDAGTIKHREFVDAFGGETATLRTINDWVGPDGTKFCEDERTFVFGADGEFRWIDVVLKVTATEGELVFGDTKEGSFGVRVAGTMREDVGLGGRIVTSEGAVGTAEAWGKPARWVDYHGPVGDSTVGIAIMNHPTSYGFPSHWHVRGYGLFAANPFGLHDFYGADAGKNGSLTLEQGDSMTLKYRVLIHPGDHEEGRVEAFYEDYVDQD